MLAPGTTAPAFRAESTMGPIDLSNELGKRPVVLIFYPKDETPVCTKQLCAVRDSRKHYEAHGAIVLGINPGTLEEHRRFAAKNKYDFPIVTDSDEAIRKQYEVGKILGLFGQQRVVYVIGTNGRIVYAEKGNRPTDEIMQALEKAQPTD
ncbi:peroxiredoxin [Paenibacillus filicis]|uniref:thioredoxin-dependent peroxiredoxin n=1 Tax=Paenibacillus gyeongsangnamensis TaxID=3388067 RepID=A0ABT4Q5H4_9BACL|nr:peroxiredoxin [Paenibacillus filicis]MCZ8512069.1 peroxiredoxin [Paenibacillus filicis]